MTKKNLPQIRIEKITPAKARAYLDLSPVDRRRKVRKGVLERLIADLEAGEWQLTADPIKFNTAGDLIDGHHRLNAIIETGKTVQVAVARNVPPDAVMVIDTGAPRTPTDILAIFGRGDVAHVAPTVKCILSIFEIERGDISASGLAKRKLSNKALIEFVTVNSSDIEESINVVRSKEARTICRPPAVFAALHFLFSKANKMATVEFFEKLSTGMGMTSSDPVYRLRQAMIQSLGARQRRPNFVVAGMAIKAWNAFLAGQQIGALGFKSNERWPKISNARRRRRNSSSEEE